MDEGALQAWLDGARSGLDASKLEAIDRHVAACVACAARADDLARSNFRAHALLSVGRDQYAPRVPYEAVAERAHGPRPKRQPLVRRMRTTWAASIVAALAVGWASNELVPSDAVAVGPDARGTALASRSPGPSYVGIVEGPSAPPRSTGLVVQGIVEDESGRPVPSAQVSVAALDVSVLTREDGRYTLRLARQPDSFEITVERIGFRQQTRSIRPSEGDYVAADFRLREEALALDEIVVMGESEGAAPVRPIATNFRAPPFAWRASPSIAAEGYVGSNLWTLPDRNILSLEVAYGDNANETHVARVRQDLGNGVIVTLVQGRTDDRRSSWPIEPEGTVESTWRGQMLITATAPVSADSLRAILAALR